MITPRILLFLFASLLCSVLTSSMNTNAQPAIESRQTQEEIEVLRVNYGYFPEARPIHAACARGWLDLRLGNRLYQVSCYPQTSGNFAASRLDSGQLHIANLGSTPLAQAVARGVDLQVVYISHYMGDSQGIYLRGEEFAYVPVRTPFDLVNRTIGVPFGSTMHYQVLFLLDLFQLNGLVEVRNLAPSQIIDAWDNREIDAAACWGAARDFVLQNEGSGNPDLPPAGTLLSAGVLANWGRPTYVVVAVNRPLADQHREFVKHFLAVLSRINDSFVDQLGQDDTNNIQRWQVGHDASLVGSMADALMSPDEEARNPSPNFLNLQRRTLDTFVHLTADEQLSCSYLPASSQGCARPTLQHIATHQTAQFLLDQKLISNLGIMEDFDESDLVCSSSDFCGNSHILDGSSLAEANENCDGCYPLGPYAADSDILPASSSDLLSELERVDIEVGRPKFGPNEIGRRDSIDPSMPYDNGDSTCSGHEQVRIGNSFGDGANAQIGRTYSTNLACSWEIRAQDCSDPEFDDCKDIIILEVEQMRIWTGDFLKIYTDTENRCDNDPLGSTKVLLAQFSGSSSLSLDYQQPIRAKGCLLVTFDTDANLERSYGDIENLGNGFLAVTSEESSSASPTCNDFPSRDGLCWCDGFHWGGECAITDHCVGTNQIFLSGDDPTFFASSRDLRPATLENIRDQYTVDPSIAYENDLDCTYEFPELGDASVIEVSIYYDLEEGHDYIWLESGNGEPYQVLTGKHEGDREVYYIPVDSTTKSARLRMTTDSRGRRGGFYAAARRSSLEPRVCDAGYSGANCEIPYCGPKQKLRRVEVGGIDNSYLLGRAKSQAEDRSVRPMPWAPNGGCEWEFGGSVTSRDTVAVRLIHQAFDLEPYPESAPGDKLVVRTNLGEEHSFFVEECENDETCSQPWQTGVCGSKGGCIVRDTFDIPIVNEGSGDPISAFLVTDRNDGGEDFNGIFFDAVIVEACPAEEGLEHCEALEDAKCVDGACICEGGVPCACPCDGPAPSSQKLKVGLVVGIVLAIFAVFVGYFLFYRRKKIQKSRAQKDIISAKEAELDAFKNSLVGMRTAIVEFLPVMDSGVEHATLSKEALTTPGAPRIQWCWQETPHMMSNHDAQVIVGDPADCFIRYDSESNKKLESYFQQTGGKGNCHPMPGYKVDFESMTQTKESTGFRRNVQRLVQAADNESALSRLEDMDLSKAKFADPVPSDLSGEPTMVLITGDVIQISSQRQDGWAFGTKLYHSNEAIARELAKFAAGGLSEDDANIFTDTGWFQLEATAVPSGDDLALLQNNVGDTSALDPPSEWEEVADPSVVEMHKLPKAGDEYQTLLDAFMSTLKPPGFPKKAKVVGIQRIQNLAMWQSYVVKRQTICYRETGVGAGEKSAADQVAQRNALERFEKRWLWHGTNDDVMDKIMQQGFNRSFCGKNATMYGKGVYFARDASYSAYPTYAVPDKSGYQYIMACRVVVGEYCPGTMNALTPDVRDAKTQALYDSTVGLLRDDTLSNPSIYVTYHDAQAYPEYLIKFKLS